LGDIAKLSTKRGHQGETIPDSVKTEFVTWLLDPDPERSPRTAVAWAAEHGLSDDTLRNWQTNDEFVMGLLANAHRLIEPHWPLILRRLLAVAEYGEDYLVVTAAREIGRLLGKYPKEGLRIEVVNRTAYVPPDALKELSEGLYPPAPELN
jgi:hypothetical protein